MKGTRRRRFLKRETAGVVSRVARAPAPAKWILAAGAVGMVFGCGGAQADRAPDPDQSSVRVVNVEVERVEPRNFTRTIRLTGVVQAMRDVLVSAEESGVVRQIVRDKGLPIRSGAAILKLDDGILLAQVRTATAQAELAQVLWERRKKLYEEDEIGSEVSYLEAKYGAEQALGNLAALQTRLARTTVSAPINGVLDARFVEVGSMVSPGTPVARIVQMDSVKVVAGVPERFALDIVTGANATVSFDVLEGDDFAGNIAYVGAAVEPDSRTFPVELVLPNPGRRIKPEMIAEITVVQQELKDAIVVPQQALVSMEEGYVIFVVDGSGDEVRADARSVQIVAAQGNEAIIGSGLHQGDRVVVVGQQGLTDGDRVQVVVNEPRRES